MSNIKIQKWCPTCKHFFKEFELNNCNLVDWAQHPLGGNALVRKWLKHNADASTRIFDDADNCPGWEISDFEAQQLGKKLITTEDEP